MSQQAPKANLSTHSKVPRQHPSTKEVDAALSEASVFMEHGQYQSAAETLQSLSCLRCDPRIALLLAAAVEGGGDSVKAKEVLKQAHSIWPTNNSIATSLAREDFVAGQSEDAAQALSTSHVDEATPLQELELRVEVYLAVHQLVMAERVAEVAFKSYPSEQSILLLANTLQLQGRSQDVISLLQGKRGDYLNSAAFLITIAESEYDRDDYGSAHADLTRAVSLDQNSYQAHYLLGNTLFKQGVVDQAITEYRAAISLAPEKPRTYYQLALALVSNKDEPAAERSLAQALALDKSYAPAYCEIGRLLISQNHYQEAVDQLNLAIQYNPRFEMAYYLLVQAYARQGKKDESQEALKHLLAVKHSNREHLSSNDHDPTGDSPAVSP